MKRISLVFKLFSALLMGSLLWSTACTPIESITPDDVLTIVSASGTLNSEGVPEVQVPVTGTPERQVITVSANARWEVYLTEAAPAVNFVHVTPKAGGLGNQKIEYTVDANPLDIPRECTIHITVVGGDVTTTRKVIIKQEGSKFEIPAYLEGESQIDVLPAGGTGEVSLLRATRDWTVTTDADWITVNPVEGTAFNVDPNAVDPAAAQIVTWTAEANPSPTETRIAYLIFACGESYTYKVKAVQGPAALELFADPDASIALTELVDLNPCLVEEFVYVKANRAWEAQADQDWVAVDPAAAEAGVVKVKVTLQPNVDDTAREAVVTFKAGEIEVPLGIKQKAAGFVLEDKLVTDVTSPLTLEPYARENVAFAKVYTTSGKPWAAKVVSSELGLPDPTWLTVEADNENDQIKLTWEANPTYLPRNAKIYLTCDELTEIVFVQQTQSEFTVEDDYGNNVSEVLVAANGVATPADLNIGITSKTQFKVKLEKYDAADALDPAQWITITNLADFEALTAWDADFNFEFAFAKNPTEKPRQAWLTLYQEENDPNNIFVFRQVLLKQAKTDDGTIYADWTFGPDGTLLSPGSNTLDFLINNEMPIEAVLTYSGDQTDWLTLDPADGKLDNINNKSLKITAAENPKPERKATLTVTCGEIVKTITLTQKPAGAILLSGNSKVSMNAYKGHVVNRTLTLSSNKIKAEYEIQASESWLLVNFDPENFAAQPITFTTDTYNPNEEVREAVVIITQGEVKDSIKVFQEGGEFLLTTTSLVQSSEKGERKVDDIVNSNIYNGADLALMQATPWVLTPDGASWVEVAKNGDNGLILNFESNRTTKDRHASAQIQVASLAPQVFLIKQEAGHMNLWNGLSSVVTKDAKAQDFTYTNPLDTKDENSWVVETDADWFTVNKEMSGTDVLLEFRMEANPAATQRSATVVFKYKDENGNDLQDGCVREIRVVQEAGALLLDQNEVQMPIEGELAQDITQYTQFPFFVEATNGLPWKILVDDIDWQDAPAPWFVPEAFNDNEVRFSDVDFNKFPVDRYAFVWFVSAQQEVLDGIKTLADVDPAKAIATRLQVTQRKALLDPITDIELPNPAAIDLFSVNDWVNINNEEPWTISVAENNWVEVEKVSGAQLQTGFAIKHVKANPTAEPRVVMVTVTSESGNLSQSFRLIQPQTGFEVDPFILPAPASGDLAAMANKIFTFTTDNGLPVTFAPKAQYDWLQVNFNANNLEAEVAHLQPNNMPQPRSAQYVATCGEMTLEVTVTQYTGALELTSASIKVRNEHMETAGETNVVNSTQPWSTDPSLVDWQGQDPWFTVPAVENPATEKGFTVFNVQPNAKPEPRVALVTIFIGEKDNPQATAVVAVRQDGNQLNRDGLYVSTYKMGALGGVYTNPGRTYLDFGVWKPAAPRDRATGTEATWLKATADNDGYLTVTVDPNLGQQERVAEIDFVYEGTVFGTFILTQGVGELKLVYASDPTKEAKTNTISALGGPLFMPSTDLMVIATSDWEVASVTDAGTGLPVDWLTVAPDGDMLDIVVKPNPSAKARTATITLVSEGDLKVNYSVTQDGIAVSLPTPLGGVSMFVFPSPALVDYALGEVSSSSALPWTAELVGSPDWITATASGANGDDLVISLTENTTGATRTAEILVTIGGIQKSVFVKQTPADFFLVESLTVDPLNFHSNGDYAGTAGQNKVNFAANGSWTAETTASWIHLDKVAGSGSTAIQNVVVTVDINLNPDVRTGKVRILGGATPLEVTVIQEGEYLTLEYQNYDFDGGGPLAPNLEALVGVYSSDPAWTVQVLHDAVLWLAASKVGNQVKLVVQEQPSPTADPRVGTVRVTNTSGLYRDLIVSQQRYNTPGGGGDNSGWNTPTLTVYNGVGTPVSAHALITHAATSVTEFKVKSTSDWTATVSLGSSWLTLVSGSGTVDMVNGTPLTFDVAENTTGASRTAQINLTNTESEVAVLTVVQPAAPATPILEVVNNSGVVVTSFTSVPAGFSTDGFKVKSTTPWTASVPSGSWLSVDTPTGAANPTEGTTLQFHAFANPNATARTAVITISNGVAPDVTFTVTQPGFPVEGYVVPGIWVEGSDPSTPVPMLVLKNDNNVLLGNGHVKHKALTVYFTFPYDDVLVIHDGIEYTSTPFIVSGPNKQIQFKWNSGSNERQVKLRATINGETFEWTITQSWHS